MLINLVKAMNYNWEKWLQQSFVQVHPKTDETLSLIRRVITQPGRIRTRGNTLEVEVERLDNATHAASLEQVIDKFNQYGYFRLPNGSELKFRQAPQPQI